MIEGSYKKLKSFFFYDKTLLFTKKNIAEFESDRIFFENKLKEISSKLSNQDFSYFQNLISNIDFKILPKKLSSKETPSDIINGSLDYNKNINKVNFFIDIPIELSILDYLWTLLIGKIYSEQENSFKYSAATEFKKSLFKPGKDLFEDIDFESNRSFSPYYNLYAKWRKGAFKEIKKNISKKDTMLVCLDLESFYYSVEFDFHQLTNFFNDDERLNSFQFLTTIIESIYSNYTKIIASYKKGVGTRNTTSIFPIGLASPSILREIYMEPFDQSISYKLNPLYYSRYVDDVLLVIETSNGNKTESKEAIVNLFIEKGILSSKDSYLKFIGYNNLRIQQEKINCFYFQKNATPIFLKIYEKALQLNSSEANLFPDIDILKSSFEENSYNIQNLDYSEKIRDLGFLKSNNYNASRFINSLQRLVKNTKPNPGIVNPYLDQIEEFYRGSQSIEFSNSWKSIFELFLICQDEPRIKKFYKQTELEIKKLNFSLIDSNEILKKNNSKALKKLQKSLKEKLNIALALAFSLNLTPPTKSRAVQKLAKKFRDANLLNHNMVSYPLLNYFKSNHIPFNINLDSQSYFFYINLSELDQFKLKWTPRFIHLMELYLVNSLSIVINDNHNQNLTTDNLIEKYNNCNNLNFRYYSSFFVKNTDPSYPVNNSYYIVNNKINSNPKIALVNTNITTSEASNSIRNPLNNLTLDKKKKLFKILNIAKEEMVDILVFPEFYFPVAWLKDIADFAISNKISIVTGLQYITKQNRAFNCVCNVIPIVKNNNFTTGFLLLREKNFYAPEEKLFLSRAGFICIDHKKPLYYIVDNNKYRYSTILCYEFTDITSRAGMKSKIEALFVPQLNRDTNYFASIVESSARDLHCFVIQANTSEYGDSRITAPYNTISKNIMQIKGGETDVVMISTLKISELKNKRSTYSNQLRIMQHCLICKKLSNLARKNLSFKTCEKCNEMRFDKGIKGTPPNF